MIQRWIFSYYLSFLKNNVTVQYIHKCFICFWTDVYFCLLVCELPTESISKNFLTYLFFKYLSKTFMYCEIPLHFKNEIHVHWTLLKLCTLSESFQYTYVIFSNVVIFTNNLRCWYILLIKRTKFYFINYNILM